MIGHDRTAGMVLVFPNQAADVGTLRAEMSRGLSEDGLWLAPREALKPFGSSGLAGPFTGRGGQGPLTAFGIGVCLPGGGAYVLAVASPGAYSKSLERAAAGVARSIRPLYGGGGRAGERRGAVPASTPLASHFVGLWKTCSRYTERTVRLNPDGTYYDSYVASYGGGDSAGIYGRGDRASGRWSVQGTRERGILLMTDGEGTSRIEYHVHAEGGRVYWSEYYFDGVLYGKQ